jgi:hypothetical protein
MNQDDEEPRMRAFAVMWDLQRTRIHWRDC